MNGDELSANDRAAPANDSDLLVQSAIDYEMHILDLEGRVASWSPGAQRIKGYSAEEIIGKHFSIFYTEEDQAAGAPAHALQLARDEGRFQTDGWRVRKDGSRYWAQVTINPILQDGTVVGFAKIARDISAERDAHLAALETGTRYRLLVQGVIDYAIYMLDPKGYITNWNTGAERIKGYSAAEIIGDHFSRFYTPEDFDNGVPLRALETARLKGRYEAEGWRVRKDGTRFWAAVVIDAIRNEAGELIGFAKVTRDLSERKAAEEELEKAREQLFQAQKMEAVGQLTGGIAHDFNNFVMAINSGLKLIEKHVEQGQFDQVGRYLEAAKKATSRAATLTQRLLAFSRRQNLDPRVVDVNRLVRDIEDLISRTIGSGIAVRIEAAETVPLVLCDPHQLENAVVNLCINSRDAMPNGGHLTIRTAAIRLEADAARELSLAAGTYVTLAVTDTGLGMSPEVMASAFDPFFTTKPVGEGTGLGLSMVYGFVKQSGGMARIESRVGVGTTVRLYLPTHVEGAATPGQSGAQ